LIEIRCQTECQWRHFIHNGTKIVLKLHLDLLTIYKISDLQNTFSKPLSTANLVSENNLKLLGSIEIESIHIFFDINVLSITWWPSKTKQIMPSPHDFAVWTRALDQFRRSKNNWIRLEAEFWKHFLNKRWQIGLKKNTNHPL
jgi:hypothetical protein